MVFAVKIIHRLLIDDEHLIKKKNKILLWLLNGYLISSTRIDDSL